MADSTYIKIQKLANSSAKSVQKLVNKANKEALKFNAEEAEKQRKYNQQEAATARQFNADEAQKSRDWNEYMSNTAHQREVEDLKAAGLNPVLSAGGGAQSYTSASASAQAASANNASASLESGAGAVSGLYSSLMNTYSGLEQTKLNNAAALKAANISGSYALRAAETAASASRYVADRNYQTQMDKPQSSKYALIDKYFGKIMNTKEANSLKKYVDKLSGNITFEKNGNFSFTGTGKTAIKNGLKTLGLDFTGNNADLFVKAFYSNDYAALKKLEKLARNTKQSAKNISSNSPFAGNNWNPYG